MKIIVGRVEGKTNKKGIKQNRIFENVLPSRVPKFYTAYIKNTEYSLFNVNGDWSLLGIMKPCSRMSYTENFQVIEE